MHIPDFIAIGILIACMGLGSWLCVKHHDRETTAAGSGGASLLGYQGKTVAAL